MPWPCDVETDLACRRHCLDEGPEPMMLRSTWLSAPEVDDFGDAVLFPDGFDHFLVADVTLTKTRRVVVEEDLEVGEVPA